MTVTAGHTLVAYAWTFNSNNFSTYSLAVTDTSGSNVWEAPSAGTTHALDGSIYEAGGVEYVCNAAGGTYTFTLAPSFNTGTAQYPTLGVAEISGVSNSSGTGCADASAASAATNTTANASITSGSVSTSLDFIFGGVRNTGSAPVAQQTSILTYDSNFNMEWTTGPSSGTQTMGWTSPSGFWLGGVLGLKPGGGGGGGTVANPSISPASGAYTSPQTVTITDSTTGATICYTTNGTTPAASTPGTCDAGSTTYTGSFSLTIPSGGATVKALGTLSGDTNSNVTTNTYTLSGGSGPSVYYYIEDSLGSSRVITDSSGNLCYDTDFYPFGGEKPNTTSCVQNYKFTGYERDAESGLDNAQARYNSSSLGRFMSPDPVGNFVADATNPQTWNMYAYVNNNPLAFIDPTGLCGETYLDIFDDGSSLTFYGEPCPPGDDMPWIQPLGYGVGVMTMSSFEPGPGGGGGGGGGSPTVSGVCPLNSDGVSSCIAAPNNGPTWKQKNQDCLNTINNTPDGKFYDFFSPLSMIPGIGPDWKGSVAEDVGGSALKVGAYSFFNAASKSMVRTPFGSMSGFVADTIETVAKKALVPVAAAATVGQLTVHAGCAISAAF